MSADNPVRFENSQPILRVENMAASLHFYVNQLGFKNADWGDENFTSVNRDQAGIYLCRGDQGRAAPGSGSAWKMQKGSIPNSSRVEYPSACHPRIIPGLTNSMWKTPTANVLRFGSEPK